MITKNAKWTKQTVQTYFQLAHTTKGNWNEWRGYSSREDIWFMTQGIRAKKDDTWIQVPASWDFNRLAICIPTCVAHLQYPGENLQYACIICWHCVCRQQCWGYLWTFDIKKEQAFWRKCGFIQSYLLSQANNFADIWVGAQHGIAEATIWIAGYESIVYDL